MAGACVLAESVSDASESSSEISESTSDAADNTDSTDTAETSASEEGSNDVDQSPVILKSDGTQDFEAEAAARLKEPVQTNEIENWPQGPAVSAESAILMDASTGAVLYGKNIHEKLYPASTTKMMAALLAAENLDLDDTVTFSETAIYSVPADGSNMGMDVGETITVREALYGVMVASANEAVNALAEKVAGSIDAFVDMMNARAQELGCTETHFVTANGLHDPDHYTSAHDLACIAVAFFENDKLRTIGNAVTYHISATDTQPDDFDIYNHHQLINGTISCKGIIGGKTGYTQYARNTLVTGCERSGLRLICVVMKEENPTQYTDTAALFEYGYANFSHVNASKDSRYTVKSPDFMNSGTDLLGDSASALTVDADAKILLPSTLSLDQLETETDSSGLITYSWQGTFLGTAQLIFHAGAQKVSESSIPSVMTSGFVHTFVSRGEKGTIYINLIPCLICLGCLLLAVLVFFITRYCIRHQVFIPARRRRRQYTMRSSPRELYAPSRHKRKNHYSAQYNSWEDDDFRLDRTAGRGISEEQPAPFDDDTIHFINLDDHEEGRGRR